MPTPVRRSPSRWVRAAALAAAGSVVCAGACAGAGRETKPVATLASSPEAAAAFAEIRRAWRDPDTTPTALRAKLRRFVSGFPDDGLVPLARVYIALLALQQGDYAAADEALAATEHLPPGTARDLRTVARARRLRLRSDPEEALVLLRPLLGKGVDPIARAIFEEELTLSALATHRDYEAISYMDAWIRASSEEERQRTLATVTSLVQRLPRDVLVGSLQAMRAQRTNLGYGVDIERILASSLARVAVQSHDVVLARALLDPDAGALVVEGDAGLELGELATSRRGLNVVEGRTIGLLLPTASPELRDESADVLRGVMWALGLPRGLRSPTPTHAAEPPDAAPLRDRCAPRQAAPSVRAPDAPEGLRLVTRDDSGRGDRTEVSLDELAGEGAAIIVAGLEGETAERALRWGEAHEVPVVTLAAPGSGRVAARFGFVIGEPRTAVIDALARAVPSLAEEDVAPVVDSSEVRTLPPAGGRVGALALLPPVSCDIPPARAGEPRFPVSEWAHDRTAAWLVSGSPGCGRDVTAELSAAGARGVVALTLEAAGFPPHAAALRVVTAAAGRLPFAENGPAQIPPVDDEVAQFTTTLGSIDWWTALGRDAGTLARVAVDNLPADTVGDPAAVRERRARARDFLAAARAPLWTSEASAFTSSSAAEPTARTLPRTVCAIDTAAPR